MQHKNRIVSSKLGKLTVMSDAYQSVGEKVAAIFRELAGERSKALDGSVFPTAIKKTVSAALANENGDDETIIHKVDEIAFHLTDWNSDAAFLVALHLFPERFTQEEIDAGISMFLVHVPSHVIAAARLTGNSTDDVFGREDKD
jgi:hypothetical protein